MRKILFFTLMLLGAISSVAAQTVIFEETFESITGQNLPAGWKSVDRKFNPADTMSVELKWEGFDSPSQTNTCGFSGKVGLMSSNFSSDALLISPEINLQAGNNYSLSFLIGTCVVSGSNHYAVYILPAGSAFTGTETPVLEENVSTGNAAMQKEINISSFAGQDITIYFRQYNSSSIVSFLIVDNVKIVQQSVLGTTETKQESNIGIYPNPTSDYVYLKSKSKISKAEIFDATGRKLNASVNDNKVDLKNLQPGTYMISITTGDTTYSQKVIKK